MTIRYTCTGCESVLKIKDEKAGTNGKCPKCKLDFVVPSPEFDDAGADRESSPVDLVDMPIELTPDVPESEEFDPLAVLGGPPGKSSKPAAAGSARPIMGDRKPSVAELMKDFEGSKKNRREDSAPEVPRPTASSAAETSGSAANALTRAYQQKRDSASAPSISAKDAKAAEQRILLMDFIKKTAIPGILIVSVLLYGYYRWNTKVDYAGPPLYQVTGQILKGGSPAAGYHLRFEPISAGIDDPRQLAVADCDAEGKFRVMYLLTNYGAPAGEYRIGIQDAAFQPVEQTEALTLTVKTEGKNELKINL